MHKDACEYAKNTGSCSGCIHPCELDKSIPCSPCCEDLSPEGEPIGEYCNECDAINIV